ncbi:MAG: aspartate aminotransferase family protein, partial [Bacteroidota bacterium]
MTNRQLFLNNLAQTSDFPLMLEIEHAEGVWMTAPDGKKYLDLISGIGVSNVGHRHPRVVKALKEQADKFLHLMVYGEFVQSPQVKLAERLRTTLPDNLDNVYLLNSGSEAVEGALKLAKRYTGRSNIISCHNAYHGSSHGALSVSGDEKFKRKFRPLLPGVDHIHYGAFGDLDKINEHTACVIIETVQGEAGVIYGCSNYFKALRDKCSDMGALLIFDEIQCGFGRTGKFWAFEHFDVVPDILIAAKGMGGGMPIGAFISSQEIMSVFKSNPILGHISTFGGHPMSAVASLATIEAIQEEQLLLQVDVKANLFKSLLVHPRIKSIRSIGLMMAVEMETFDFLKAVIDEAIDLGLLTDWFLFNDRSMRIAPPLIITEEEIKKACKLILQAIDTIDSQFKSKTL